MRVTSIVPLLGLAILAACSKPEPAPTPIRAVRTMTVTSATTAGTHEYAAEVRARTESRLGFRVGGKIVRRAVNVGDAVKPGQLLAQLDPEDLKLGQDAARAALVAAQANLDQTEADYKRFKELRDQGFISSAELERRDTALKAARAQFDQARAQSSVQGNQAAYAALVADVAGVVTGVEAEPGMVVAAGAPVIRLAHDGPRDVVFSVPEDKVGVVKSLAAQPGNLKVRPWGSEAAPFPVKLREVAASADPVTRTFLVKADLGDSREARALRLGQTATVVAETRKTEGVTKLPLSALREDKGRSSVWLLDPQTMTVKSHAVEVAGAEGNEAVVTSGLAPGMVVVTAGVHVLNPGQKVKQFVEPGSSPAVATNPTAVSAK
ncbi:MAG: efflux RND transporter periplasmic adaptor subunit [Rhizobacter sp.]|jgi:multidrug efflux system membrane fusion protein